LTPHDKMDKQSNLHSVFDNLTRPRRSREAAQECSPRRKTWVKADADAAKPRRGERKEIQLSLLSRIFYKHIVCNQYFARIKPRSSPFFAPNSYALNILPISLFRSRFWEEIFPNSMILIDRGIGGRGTSVGRCQKARGVLNGSGAHPGPKSQQLRAKSCPTPA
jgi:hypothetical protein